MLFCYSIFSCIWITPNSIETDILFLQAFLYLNCFFTYGNQYMHTQILSVHNRLYYICMLYRKSFLWIITYAKCIKIINNRKNILKSVFCPFIFRKKKILQTLSAFKIFWLQFETNWPTWQKFLSFGRRRKIFTYIFDIISYFILNKLHLPRNRGNAVQFQLRMR